MAAAVRLLYDGASAEQISELVANELKAAGLACDAAAPLASVDAAAFAGDSAGRASIFVVECDREGDVPAARKLVRGLKKAAGPDAASALSDGTVAVLALAASVCAFSAASAGKEKYKGGARLLADLQALGARQLSPLGGAEVEVEEVDVHVLPWARSVCAALGGAPGAEPRVDEAPRGEV